MSNEKCSGLKRNDRSEQDLDSFNEGNQGLRTDKRELSHRYYLFIFLKYVLKFFL
jgi:hypothetical protein